MLVTNSKIEANRKNALKSTGPKSTSGKARISKNALKHGLTGGHNILPGESFEEYKKLENDVFHELNPQTDAQKFRVAHIVQLYWQRIRYVRIETQILSKFYYQS